MVLVDTSIWISLYRKENAEIGQKMWALAAANQAAICGQVWVEFLGGFRRAGERREHAKSLASFPFLETEKSAFELAADLLADRPHLGPGDAIIAATAITTGSELFTLDKAFRVLTAKGLQLF